MPSLNDIAKMFQFAQVPLDPNGYVAKNYPTEGMNFSEPRFDRFYTPYGSVVPPGGRPASDGEVVDGAPSIYRLEPLLSQLMNRFKSGQQ